MIHTPVNNNGNQTICIENLWLGPQCYNTQDNHVHVPSFAMKAVNGVARVAESTGAASIGLVGSGSFCPLLENPLVNITCHVIFSTISGGTVSLTTGGNIEAGGLSGTFTALFSAPIMAWVQRNGLKLAQWINNATVRSDANDVLREAGQIAEEVGPIVEELPPP
jgi:hypothetical protein